MAQLQFDCGGFFRGHQRQPLNVNPFTRTSTIIGVIGGYQEGGDTDPVSYSSYFGSSIGQLYKQAAAAGSKNLVARPRSGRARSPRP